MQIFDERTGKTEELEFSGKASELLSKLKINSEEVLVVRNQSLITLDHDITDDDSIKLLSVISGG